MNGRNPWLACVTSSKVGTFSNWRIGHLFERNVLIDWKTLISVWRHLRWARFAIGQIVFEGMVWLLEKRWLACVTSSKDTCFCWPFFYWNQRFDWSKTFDWRVWRHRRWARISIGRFPTERDRLIGRKASVGVCDAIQVGMYSYWAFCYWKETKAFTSTCVTSSNVGTFSCYHSWKNALVEKPWLTWRHPRSARFAFGQLFSWCFDWLKNVDWRATSSRVRMFCYWSAFWKECYALDRKIGVKVWHRSRSWWRVAVLGYSGDAEAPATVRVINRFCYFVTGTSPPVKAEHHSVPLTTV